MFKRVGKLYNEDIALGHVLTGSKIFRSFYQQEIDRLSLLNIQWALNPDSANHMQTLITPEVNYVVVKKMPIPTKDAYGVAHELMHLILYKEGFPGLFCTREGIQDAYNFELASYVNNAILDQSVDKRLGSYGFDLWENYFKMSKDQKRTFQDLNPNQTAPRKKLDFASLYILKALGWDVACQLSSRENNEFIEWFEGLFPDISQEAQKLLVFIRKTGYDTPEQVSTILWHIIDKYGLQDIFTVSVLKLATK